MKSNNSGIYKHLILGSVALVILIGVTYAFFTVLVAGGNAEVGGNIADTFEIELNTPEGEYLNATNLIPIPASEVNSSAEKTNFSVETGNNSYAVSYTLSLIDLLVSTNLQTSEFKWSLICLNDNTKSISGDFSGVTANKMTVLENVRIEKNATDSYEFRIWLANNENENQLHLLNGNFKGKFNIISHMVYEETTD